MSLSYAALIYLFMTYYTTLHLPTAALTETALSKLVLCFTLTSQKSTTCGNMSGSNVSAHTLLAAFFVYSKVS
jgi:hypothetical protein